MQVIKSTEDKAIEVAVASILIAREYKKIMISAVFLAMISTMFYVTYRIAIDELLNELTQKITVLEGNCNAN